LSHIPTKIVQVNKSIFKHSASSDLYHYTWFEVPLLIAALDINPIGCYDPLEQFQPSLERYKKWADSADWGRK
jgi:hypothetical protein